MAKANVDPCQLVIFGASGDLTERKLIPALYELHLEGRLPRPFTVLGVSRSPLGDEGFREKTREQCSRDSRYSESSWTEFASQLFYESADATDFQGFASVRDRIDSLRASRPTGENLLFYLAMAPRHYEPIITNIAAAQLVTEGQRWCSLNRALASWQRIIVEKPFGHDLRSAEHLNRVLGRVFEEEATFRIDHYLGKETVQNLIVLRFANTIFEPLWNRLYVDHVQITAAETVGVEDRGPYYDKTGALRDMIQSHLLQVLAVLAMEPPNSMHAADLRSEQRKVLQAVRGIDVNQIERCAVRARYDGGSIGTQAVPAYLAETGVASGSATETYAALRLHIDNWRWRGVPFYLRTGKRLARKLSQVCVTFKPPSHSMFRDERGSAALDPNRLVITLQPDEGITLRFEGKMPGQDMSVRSGVLDFDYVQQFGGRVPEAYAHLLLDAIEGDRSLFKNRHEIEAAWRIVTPVCEYWQAHPNRPIHSYPAGSWGPHAADALIGDSGAWNNPRGAVSRYQNDSAVPA